MYELKTNTAVRIAVGPLVDPTDGKTAETALTVTGMVVDILQMDNDGTAVNRTSFSPTASGGNNDMVHVTDDTVGMYDLELTAAQLNYLGNVRLVFYDVDGFLVHWIDLQLVSAAYFDWKYGTTLPNVNVTQISGDSTAADNCELMFDGTGYAGGTTKIDVNVATIAANAITATSINADAITNAKIADNAIAAENLAADCITSAKIADNAFANEHFADGALTSTEITSAAGCIVASIANNAITAAAIATDAIDADALAATGLSEIADAVWDEVVTTGAHDTATYAGAGLLAAASAGDPWSTALPGAYGAGTAGLLLGTTIPNAIDAIDNYVDTEIGTLTTELAKVPKSDSNVSWNATALAAIQAECNDALVAQKLDHLVAVADADDVADDSIIAKLAATAGDWSTFVDTTDSLQSIRDKLPANLEDLSIVDTTGLVDITQTAADKVWGTAARVLTANTNLANLEVDLTKIHGTELTETAGQLAAAFTKMFDVATPVLTCESVNQAQDNATVSEIADAVWDEAIADHVGAGSTGKAATDILADTNELQVDDTPTAVAAVKTVVDLVEDIIRNKMEITDANGNLVLYEDDNSTPKYSVNACVVDNSTTTTRKRLE